MLKEKLRIDDKDALILSLLMRTPSLSQQALARQLGISQPSINARLSKLTNRGVLARVAGIDAKRSGLSLARADFSSPEPERVLERLRHCSFFVNGFVMSGTRNVSVFLIGDDLGTVERIVNTHIRSEPSVSDVELCVVVSPTKEFVCTIDLSEEQEKKCSSPSGCRSCASR